MEALRLQNYRTVSLNEVISHLKYNDIEAHSWYRAI